MPATALAEVVVGVPDPAARARFFESTLGLLPLSRGTVDVPTARALWGRDQPVETVILGRPDVPGGTRIRLLAATGPPARPRRDLREPGPVGIGFTTRGVHGVFDRLKAAGIDFLSPPLRLTPGAIGPTGPVRYEAFGRAPEGDLVVLIERLNMPTPYGTISESSCASEPLHTSHVVADLEGARRFMVEVLDHECLMSDRCQGEIFEELLGIPPGTAFRFEMLHRPGFPTGRIVLMAFEGQSGRAPLVEPSGRGMTALRYDCEDLDRLTARISAAGGTVLRGPVAVNSGPLGRGRVLCVRSPLGVLFEIWEPWP